MARVLNQRVTWRLAAPLLIDGALVLSSVAISTSLLVGPPMRTQLDDPVFLFKLALVAAICQLCLYYADLYEAHAGGNSRELIVRLMRSFGVTALVLSVVYAVVPVLVVGRGVFALAVGLLLGLVPVWRSGFDWIVDRLAPSERILIVGTKPAAVSLARELATRRRELGVEVVGFVEVEPAARVRAFIPAPGIVGLVSDIPEIVSQCRVDRVVVSLEDARGKLSMTDLLDMKLHGVKFDHLASVYEEYTGRIAVENLRPSWLIFSDGFRKRRVVTITKRAVDVLAAALGMVVGGPLMLVVAAAIKLTSAGPVLYHQTRTGEGGKAFTVHKFRTMRTDAESRTGPVWASARDSRVTSLGGILRRTRLDELPQLWNILCGEMSLVGPRPERPEFVRELTEQIPFYGQRHVVKPGLTGWAQVNYTYGASVEDAMEKLQYDLFYIKNMSGILDLVIIFATIKTVLRQRGSR
jgi:sugar transferase (PEP-CTERM system associated)